MNILPQRLHDLIEQIDSDLPVLQVQLEGAPTHADHLRIHGQIETLRQRRRDAASLLQSLDS